MNKQNLDEKINDFIAGFNKLKPKEIPPVVEQGATTAEQKVEQALETPKPAEVVQEKPELTSDLTAVLPVVPAPVKSALVKSPLYYQVEGILAEGMEEAYQKLAPAKQLE